MNAKLTRYAAAVGVIVGLVGCASDGTDETSDNGTAPVTETSEVPDSTAASDSVATTTTPTEATAPALDTLAPDETVAPRAIGDSTGPLPPHAPPLAPVGPGPVEFTAFDKSFSITLPDAMNGAEGPDFVVLESADSSTQMVFFTTDAYVNVESPLFDDQLVDPLSELRAGMLAGRPVTELDSWVTELDSQRLVTAQAGGDLLVGVAPRNYQSFLASLPNIEATTNSPALAIVGLDQSVIQILGDRQYRIYELDDGDDAWYVLVTDPGIAAQPGSSTTSVDNLLRTLEELYK